MSTQRDSYICVCVCIGGDCRIICVCVCVCVGGDFRIISVTRTKNGIKSLIPCLVQMPDSGFLSTLKRWAVDSLPLVGLVTKSCLTLATLWTVARQAPLSRDFLGKNSGVGCHSFSIASLILCKKKKKK